MKNEDPFIRKEAVMCLGLLSLLSKDFAMQHLILFLQVRLLQIVLHDVDLVFNLF